MCVDIFRASNFVSLNTDIAGESDKIVVQHSNVAGMTDNNYLHYFDTI